MIISAAISINGLIISLPPPARHNDIIFHLGFKLKNFEAVESSKGFITVEGKFVDREEAAYIAIATGQIRPDKIPNGKLYTEDLW